MSEEEFAVLTVLIRVRVNDSAPSLGTHYRAGMGAGQKERERERKLERERERRKSQ